MTSIKEPLAIIGGSGLYSLDALSETKSEQVQTPYGYADVYSGYWNGRAILFLARHGKTHQLAPHQINYRANVWALHKAGAKAVLIVNCVGGIHPGLSRPGTFCAPDQLLDFTQSRQGSFCEEGLVNHVDMTEPFDKTLRNMLIKAGHKFDIFTGACCYAAMQGPRFETRAEINFLEKIGADVAGMTAMPEVALVREKDLPVCMLSLVVNPAAGRGGGPITEAAINKTLKAGMRQAQALVARML